jgi:hypothetical protein
VLTYVVEYQTNKLLSIGCRKLVGEVYCESLGKKKNDGEQDSFQILPHSPPHPADSIRIAPFSDLANNNDRKEVKQTF